MIKEAAKLLGVETHVLRYWEDELELVIKRNSMGHRYYDERDIKMFKGVMELKERGMSLKDIRTKILQKKRNSDVDESDIHKNIKEKNIHRVEERTDVEDVAEEEQISLGQKQATSLEEKQSTNDDYKVVDFKVAQMQAVMNKIVANALRENKEIITTSIKSEITEDVMRQFDTVMREKEEKEEARFRKLDEVLRQIQKANEEVAATKMRKRFGRRRL